MAAGRWCRVLTGCRMHALMRDHTCGISLLKKACPIRQFAAVKASKKVQTDPKRESNKPKVERKTNSYRNRTRRLTALEPIDDVFQVQYYPKPVFDIETAIDSLKKFQQLDFTYPKQPVYIDLQLDMKLEKKKKVDPFIRILQLPYNFRTQFNSVVVFTENPEEVTVAQQHGADVVGGTELIQKILDEEVQGDFYVSTPDMVSKLVPLKNKLRKKFPKNKRGSVGHNIPEMIKVFQTGHEYQVERDCFVLSKVGTLDMPKEHITANVAEIIKDVCTQRPVSFGPFVRRAIICSATSESLLFKAEPFLPQITEDNEENQEHNG
ncbi:39S ribosomal protein L1, mitochondrial [Leucoraja erinacea]|uniref:39S ribosomal protein L1, mitochondrial n=1 Tax=Leucoraja erinaceus TaxID=7782 RepID=UPI002454F9FA|nr:39S ribosomal protein L1, mitochondrial [Leucoraja erinacea]